MSVLTPADVYAALSEKDYASTTRVVDVLATALWGSMRGLDVTEAEATQLCEIVWLRFADQVGLQRPAELADVTSWIQRVTAEELQRVQRVQAWRSRYLDRTRPSADV